MLFYKYQCAIFNIALINIRYESGGYVNREERIERRGEEREERREWRRVYTQT